MAMNPSNRVTLQARQAGKTLRQAQALVTARGEIVRPARMNATEAAYGEVLRADETIVWCEYEGVTLRLGDECRYTPDYAVMRADGAIEMHEVKGFWREDALVKIKVAARMYPFRFFSAVKRKKKAGGGFEVREFKS